MSFVDQLEAGATYHENTGDIGLPFILRKAAARIRALEAGLLDIIGACNSFCDCDGDVVSSEVRDLARALLSGDADRER